MRAQFDRWHPMWGPVYADPTMTDSEPEHGPPFVAIRGLTGCSFCLRCSRALHPSERCSGMSRRAREELAPEQLFSTSMCPLDLEDEYWRRKHGATRAELEQVEQFEQDLKQDEESPGGFLYIPGLRRLRRRKKVSD
jgi:hypothetical protein